MALELRQMATETHFEVHALRNGRWQIESTSLERATAVEDAKSLIRQSDIRGVKVFKETVNNDTGRAAAISVFDQIKPERRQQARTIQAQARPVPLASAPRPASRPEPVRRPRTAKPAPEPTVPLWMIVATGVVMIVAAVLFLFTMQSGPEPETSAPAMVHEKPPWLSKPLQ